MFLFFKSTFKVWSTDVAGTPVALESSSHVARRSSSKSSATRLFYLLIFFGLPGHGSLSMLTQPVQKRLAQRETLLQSSVDSPQTLLNVPWISVGLLPRKVLILINEL